MVLQCILEHFLWDVVEYLLDAVLGMGLFYGWHCEGVTGRPNPDFDGFYELLEGLLQLNR